MESELNTTHEDAADGGPADAAEPEASLSSVVGELWQDAAEESVTEPEPEAAAETETEAEPVAEDPDSAAEPDQQASPEAPKFYTPEEIAEPGFWGRAEMDRVPPHIRDEFKHWQGAFTREQQRLKKAAAEAETKTQPPKPEDDAETGLYSPEELNAIMQSKAFRAGVEKYLGELGIDLTVLKDQSQETLFARAAKPVLDAYPELTDPAFLKDVERAMLADTDLSTEYESNDPRRQARAMRLAAAEVRAARLKAREGALTELETKKAKEIEAARKQKEAANRKFASASKASEGRKAPPAPTGNGTLRDDFDALLEENPDFGRAFQG